MKLIDLVTEDMLANFNTTKEKLIESRVVCSDEMGFKHECHVERCDKCWIEEVSKDSSLYIQHVAKQMFHKAEQIAFNAHDGQKDKSGNDYIDHPRHIVFCLDDYRDKIVAILHDTIEDTFITTDYLRANGVDNEELLSDLLLLTHVEEDSYKTYIEKIYQSGSDRAKRIKLLDLTHNMDISRLNKFREKDIDRITKYATAYVYLKTGEWLKEI